MDEHASALEVAAAIRAMDVSPLEVLDASLGAGRRAQPRAQRRHLAQRRRGPGGGQALGRPDRRGDEELPPFAGVPLPIKDLLPVAGQPVTYGSTGCSGRAELDRASPWPTPSVRAGFVLTGRTNTPEFGSITVTENSRFGATRNPWNPDHTPGGSSGGAAAAVVVGHVPGGPRQ